MKITFLILFALLVVTNFAFPQTVSTFAGTPQTSGFNPSSTARLSAKFNLPYGLAFDGQGNLWVSEIGNHTIRMIDASGNVHVRAGGVGQACFKDASGITSRFNGPYGIAVGPNNEIYVADFYNHVIRKITAFTNLGNAQAVSVFAGKHTVTTGCYTSFPGYANGSASVAQFQSPADIDVDASGNLYVADMGNHVIRKITPTGIVSLVAGQPGSSGSANGNALTTAKFSSPSGITVMPNGDIYVADRSNSAIRKISGGQVSTITSSLWIPENVVVENSSTFFITDQHRVRKYSNSLLTTYAGSPTLNQSGYVDGTDTTARFYNVKSMIRNSSDGFLYIADMDNHIIRKVTIPPTSTFTASSPICFGDTSLVTYTGSGTTSATYNWSFDGGTIISGSGQGPYQISWSNTGIKNVTLFVIENSLNSDTTTVSVTINPIPTSTFTVDSVFCTDVNDTIIYTGSASSNASYAWNFNSAHIVSGSGQGPIVLNWSNSGVKNITLKVTENSCVSSQSSSVVNVSQTPTSSFIADTIICLGEDNTITYNGNASINASYTWDFSGANIVSGGSGQGPHIVDWSTSGSKNVTLEVTENSCKSSLHSISIVVNPIPTTDFLADTMTCVGDNEIITYTGTGTSGGIYSWEFGDANISSGSGRGPFTIDWSTSGIKKITLKVSENGCTSSKDSLTVNVYQIPTSTFTLGDTVCANINDNITYTGTASSSAIYTWDFDGGTASGSDQGPHNVNWSTSGTKTITLTVIEYGCTSSQFSDSIYVKFGPTSNFYILDTSICQGAQVAIYYTGSGSPSANYDWNFDGADITSGSGQGPYFLSWPTSGTKNIRLTVNESSCTSTVITNRVHVNQTPTTDFTHSDSLCSGDIDIITYTGTALSTATYIWDFDGATIISGIGQGPYTVNWMDIGSKNIKLSITENECSSDLRSETVIISPYPSGPVITQSGDTLISSSLTDNQWYDSIGIIPGATQQSYLPTKSGLYYVIVTNEYGCSNFSQFYSYTKNSITNNSQESILRIYPNPVYRIINIEYNGKITGIEKVCLYNSDGKLLIQNYIRDKVTEIDASSLTRGFYILKMISEDSIIVDKLLKY